MRTVIHIDDLKDKQYPTLVNGVCSGCGASVLPGEYPFCPHGFGHNARIHDEIPGGLWLENYGPHPIKVYSHTERRAIMAERGLREKETFAPLPGTDRDPQGIPNPNGYRDLSAGAILARNGGRGVDPSAVGGPAIDDTDRWDIPNDPSLAERIARPLNDVEILTHVHARKLMEQS